MNETLHKWLNTYFNLMPDKDDEAQVIAQVEAGVSFRGANLWVLIFAILTASLGLNVNSTAVIIGAMLISPLMGPIIGMGLALGIGDIDLLKRAAKNYAVATLISIVTATLYFLLTPIDDIGSELLARTWPTLFDVLIAFCGGAAGFIALATRGKGNVIPGVAIATALMPPLCTAGFAIANAHWAYFFGAFYLFFINTVFICAATFAGTRMMGFARRQFLSANAARHSRNIITAIIVLTMIPATIMTVTIISKSIFDNRVSHFVQEQIAQQGTQIIATKTDIDRHQLTIVAIGREITQERQDQAQQQLANYNLDKYTFTIVQGAQTDSILELNRQMNTQRNSIRLSNQQITDLAAQNAALNDQLIPYQHLRQLTPDISHEAVALFPEIEAIALGKASQTLAGDTTHATRQFISAIITTEKRQPLNRHDADRLEAWLKQRLAPDSIVIIYQN